ncbi:hypothetical protein BUALT_Bualt05G0000600 [Buddleja alternifolia]|uniref:Retrotransposon Copia-like N-terminal domain-containing protein n=1 Tax=Buddleja alternifolia TaxID=168488 RepID=A0AAV6XMC2_9LAMI|nr:hypothetical protein BUALT_Bualt05G0000600 [Buddleja alternifolia]
MSSDKYDAFLVHFNGKNYSAWAFHFHIFVEGKGLWGHVDGSNPAPDRNKDKDEQAKWDIKDAQIMEWIQGSVEPNITLNLRPFKTAAETWSDLKKLYSLSSVQSVHETTIRDQFLMKLRPEFEGTRSNLMNRDTVPSLDSCLNDLFREKQRLLTQTTWKNKNPPSFLRLMLHKDQQSGKMIARGPKVGSLFPLQFRFSECSPLPFLICNSAYVDYQAWNKSLGHPNKNVLQDLLKSGLLWNKRSPILNDVQFDCNACKLGKSKTPPFTTHTPNVVQHFDLIHSEVWGMAPVTSPANYKSSKPLLVYQRRNFSKSNKTTTPLESPISLIADPF